MQSSYIWKFKDPDSGRVHEAPTREALTRLIVKYRAQNQLEEIENLPMVLEDYLCRLPENAGKCSSYMPLKRGVMSFLKGGVTLLKNLAYKNFAPQNLADARSEICAQCPKNIKPDSSQYFIKWTDSMAAAMIGDKRSKEHDRLWNCAVCSCPLRGKVWIDPSDLEVTEEDLKKFPDFCWQKIEYLKRKNG